MMRYLVTGPDNLLLTSITTGRVLFTAVMLDDKSLRVGDLDKVVRVLLGRDALMQVRIVVVTKISVTYTKQRAHVS